MPEKTHGRKRLTGPWQKNKEILEFFSGKWRNMGVKACLAEEISLSLTGRTPHWAEVFLKKNLKFWFFPVEEE
ncbi:hypothetical protein [uncultured Desulfovibrio sp.]|uniref:hypothetical protein n=1 Tax=uncultured Desulfovibrio sp. TaxID=167968 RepID=UPI00261C90CB|nr:hypothetical protein [uncultured Desulfovibrio sp.]